VVDFLKRKERRRLPFAVDIKILHSPRYSIIGDSAVLAKNSDHILGS
jgi:hypothetical protein